MLVVLLEPVADHLGLVVVADRKRAAVEVADALLPGRVELDVEDVAVLLAGPPPAQPANHLVVVDVDQQDSGQPPVELGETRRQCLRLGLGAREAVEDEAVGRLGGVDPLGDHADDHLVGDQVAAIHVLLRGAAQLGLVADRRPQDVPGRVVRQPQVFVKALPLGSLAAAGRAQENEI